MRKLAIFEKNFIRTSPGQSFRLTRAARFLLALLLLPHLGGCAAVLIGTGVAAGAAVAKDTVELHADRPYNSVWAAATREIKNQNGTVVFQDKKGGKIEAVVPASSADKGESKVEITLKNITEKTVQVRIKARKNLFPDIETANALSTKIASRL